MLFRSKSKLKMTVFMLKFRLNKADPCPGASALGTLRVREPESQIRKEQFRVKIGGAAGRSSAGANAGEISSIGPASMKRATVIGGKVN